MQLSKKDPNSNRVADASSGVIFAQTARSGAISLEAILIVSFAAHNMAEGFGIVAPLGAGGLRPSWRFLGLAGVIGGGPTFLGTILGHAFQSDTLFVHFLHTLVPRSFWPLPLSNFFPMRSKTRVDPYAFTSPATYASWQKSLSTTLRTARSTYSRVIRRYQSCIGKTVRAE